VGRSPACKTLAASLTDRIPNYKLMDELKFALAKYIDIDDGEFQTVSKYFKTKKIPKGSILIKRGQQSNDLFFIVKGALRVYWQNGEQEITGWFAFENDFFCHLSSFISKEPSLFEVQSIENVELYYITRKDIETLYKELPKFETFVRKFWEIIIKNLIKNIVSFQTETAKQRYDKAIKNSVLIERVPLKYLSSFLGVTPSSLSRIRKQK